MITLSPSSWWLCISLPAQHLAWQFFSGQDFQAECGTRSSSHPWQTMRGRPRMGMSLAQGHQEDWQSRKDTTPWILAAHSTKKGYRGSFCLAGVSGLEAPCQDGAVKRVWRAFIKQHIHRHQYKRRSQTSFKFCNGRKAYIWLPDPYKSIYFRKDSKDIPVLGRGLKNP